MGRPLPHADLVAVPTVRPASNRAVSAVPRGSRMDSPALKAVLDAVWEVWRAADAPPPLSAQGTGSPSLPESDRVLR